MKVSSFDVRGAPSCEVMEVIRMSVYGVVFSGMNIIEKMQKKHVEKVFTVNETDSGAWTYGTWTSQQKLSLISALRHFVILFIFHFIWVLLRITNGAEMPLKTFLYPGDYAYATSGKKCTTSCREACSGHHVTGI